MGENNDLLVAMTIFSLYVISISYTYFDKAVRKEQDRFTATGSRYTVADIKTNTREVDPPPTPCVSEASDEDEPCCESFMSTTEETNTELSEKIKKLLSSVG
jgi:hypothetical protein